MSRFKVEIVMNELRKNQKFHFDLQIHPTLLNSQKKVFPEWPPEGPWLTQ